jgi:hypothetical protein
VLFSTAYSVQTSRIYLSSQLKARAFLNDKNYIPASVYDQKYFRFGFEIRDNIRTVLTSPWVEKFVVLGNSPQ